MTQVATKRCVLCDQDKPQTKFQMTSIGRKPMCRLCCYGTFNERKVPLSRDARPSLPVKPVYVPLNAEGRRIGEQHPRAKLLDSEVDLVFELREVGLSYFEIAKKMGISKSAAAHICKGRRRCQTPERWVQISPPLLARPPRPRGRPITKPKPVQTPALPDGVAELQAAINCWR